MSDLFVTGRGFYCYPGPLHYLGCVSTNPDKSNRADDIVQSLPVTSPSEALTIGRELRETILAERNGQVLPPHLWRL